MSEKKGLFGWFGRKNKKTEASQDEQQPAVSHDSVEESRNLKNTESALEDALEGALDSSSKSSDTKVEPVAETMGAEENLQQSHVAEIDIAEKADLAAEEKSASETTEQNSSVAIASNDTASNDTATNDTASNDTGLTEQALEIQTTAASSETQTHDAGQPEPQEKPKKGLFARLKASLSRTKESIGSGLFSLFKGKTIDDELYEDLETQLLMADVGIDTTTRIIDSVTQSAERKQLKDAESLYTVVKDKMRDILGSVNEPLIPEHSEDGPFVILMVGVNGVGKTTTIGKLAKKYQQQGKSVMLAAGDTFRAAAVEQLQVWGQRNDIPVVAQHTGADSASVLYDAFASAKSKNCDVLIADTAGRLQNKSHLMEELKKIVRVMKKIDAKAPHEVMLVLDAATGQNAISQTKLFREAVGLTGITLTKLDGTAKGGIIFALADQFKVPIRYIGVGEGIDDLRDFDADDFIDALFEQESQEQAQ
ncbi:signal recognition particle-docking protein FtsY [Catenovulum sediminis]|uniref:signal recognition particle-docking protein FtsY n=1 Tax=Catenovulum sediminis TaxID=1740262 RepID=UPI001C8F9CD6|nr:signal recognition particle-docking protein FtsY [Catenovulum sediminis]